MILTIIMQIIRFKIQDLYGKIDVTKKEVSKKDEANG